MTFCYLTHFWSRWLTFLNLSWLYPYWFRILFSNTFVRWIVCLNFNLLYQKIVVKFCNLKCTVLRFSATFFQIILWCKFCLNKMVFRTNGFLKTQRVGKKKSTLWYQCLGVWGLNRKKHFFKRCLCTFFASSWQQ